MGITIDTMRQTPGAWRELKSELSDEQQLQLMHDWWFLARDEQLPQETAWKYWMYMAGRGSGKTRTGAEWVRDLVKGGARRGSLIAPTAADARDVMVEGESGIISICQAWDVMHDGTLLGRPLYEPSKRRITWSNGAAVTMYSADEPERLRGPQHEFIWADEIGAWRYMEALDQALLGLRLGLRPQVLLSTTPRQNRVIKEMYTRGLDPDDKEVILTRGSSERNEANLAPGVLQELRKRYAGTSQGRQELDGELLEEMDGALWTRKLINKNRIEHMPGATDPAFYFKQIMIGVDPAVSAKEGADETGIIVAGLGNDDHVYILADLSGMHTPGQWAAIVSEAYHEWSCDKVVVEVNQGGDMVEQIILDEDPSLEVTSVRASKNKKMRAEPVVHKYEQGLIHHVGTDFEILEDQMCSWEYLVSTYSPDRIDALGWVVNELIIKGDKPILTGKLRGM